MKLPLAPLMAISLILATPSARARQAIPAEHQRYLTKLHNKIHAMWVGVVLARAQRALGPQDPFNHPHRKTTLRIRVSSQGTIESADVIRSSGHPAFDATARSVVLGIIAPPRPPATGRSADGDLYVEWVFHRSRPWCHPQNATIRVVPFTVSVLGRGRIPQAVALLRQAHRRGQLSTYGHDFGRQLLNLAVKALGSRAAPMLLRYLDRPQPLHILRAVFRGSLTGAALRRAVGLLARQKTPAADALLGTLFSINFPGQVARAAVYLQSLALRPTAARAVWKKVRAAATHPSRRLAAPAAKVLLQQGDARDKALGERVLYKLLSSRQPDDRRAALAQLDAGTLGPRFLAAVKRIGTTPHPETVHVAVAHLLGRVGNIDAGTLLLRLSLDGRPRVARAALEALGRVAGPHRERCARYLALAKSSRAHAGLRTEAATGLARHCLRDFHTQIKRLVRRRRVDLRLGLARGLPGGEPRAARLLKRLARDRNARVRRAALGTMLQHPSRAWRRVLKRNLRKNTAAFRALQCRYTKDPALRRRCFTSSRGEARLRLARELVRTAPRVVFPWLLPLLESASWRQRLRAAWVLLALPAP